MKGFLSLQSILVMAVAVVLGAALLYTSQATQDADGVLAGLKRGIEQGNEAIALLEAEWAYLNSPQRLEKLAVEFYGVATPSAAQMMGDMEELDLPFPAPIDAQAVGVAQMVSYDAAQPVVREVEIVPLPKVRPIR